MAGKIPKKIMSAMTPAERRAHRSREKKIMAIFKQGGKAMKKIEARLRKK